MAKPKPNTFSVGFFIKQWLEVEIAASTLEEALAAGRKLSIGNVFEMNYQCTDSSIKVIQAYDPDFEI